MEECIKCGSPLNDEIWKTDGLEFEEYICSNNKCCAVHTINIIRWDDDGRRKEECVDIERLWDTLEFSYIWEEGLKPIAKINPMDSEGKYIYLDSKNNIEFDAQELCHFIEYGAVWNLEVDVPNQEKPILVSVKLKYNNEITEKTKDKFLFFRNYLNYYFKNVIKS